MASSNRHWPSLFKSKPCNTHHNQWQHDPDSSSLVSSGCYRLPYTSVAGCEERTPEPKPRWNPKPEQIRILEEIFNSGMVNPPRDEIRKIRAQLQEYGQVGDANVFYWFQNRKSRSKQKSRHVQSSNQQCSQHRLQQTGHNNQTSPSNTSLPVAPASASSSSEKSSPKGPTRALSLTPPTANSVNQAYFQGPTPADLVPEPFFFPMQQAGPGGIRADALGIDFSELSNVVQGQGHTAGPCTGLLLSGDVLDFGAVKKHHQRDKAMIIQPQPSYSSATPISIAHSINDLAPLLTPSTTSTNSSVTLPSTINQVQDAGELPGPAVSAIRSMVFINDVAFEVVVGSFNVREAFGHDVVLIHSSGQPVLTDERGVTLCPLQHGASYYLVPLFHI